MTQANEPQPLTPDEWGALLDPIHEGALTPRGLARLRATLTALQYNADNADLFEQALANRDADVGVLEGQVAALTTERDGLAARVAALEAQQRAFTATAWTAVGYIRAGATGMAADTLTAALRESEDA